MLSFPIARIVSARNHKRIVLVSYIATHCLSFNAVMPSRAFLLLLFATDTGSHIQRINKQKPSNDSLALASPAYLKMTLLETPARPGKKTIP
jgi:hypothetical protein